MNLWRLGGLLASLAFMGCSASPARVDSPGATPYFDVRTYGAHGNGTTLDTPAINAAIDAAAAAGGGTVYFRAGTYPSFSIHLKSNITLYLDQGAIILAAGPTLGGYSGPAVARPAGFGADPMSRPNGAAGVPPPAFDPPENNPNERSRFGSNQDFGHSHWHNSLIWGENLHDVAIMGPGMIDGNGLAYNPPAEAVGVGNKALALKQCQNVTLRDFTFYRGGHFCILATAVDNFTVDAVKFDTIRDGIDVVSCKNVRIANCYVNSPIDDGICLKADYSLGKPRDCENVTITNCQVSGYRVGTMLDGTLDRTTPLPGSRDPIGRIKFGTESNGGFKNITISNCVFDRCRGLAIESVDGGVIEDVTVSNIAMRDLSQSPLFIRLGNRHRSPLGPDTPVAQMRRINISNITASGADSRYPVDITGLPGHPIEDLRLSNIRIAYRGGGTAAQVVREIPENEGNYPEPDMFGVLNASAFFIRHVRGLEMHHIDVTFDTTDARPALWLNDVAGADFQHMNVQRFDRVPLFSLNKVTDFATQYVRSVADSKRDVVEQEFIAK